MKIFKDKKNLIGLSLILGLIAFLIRDFFMSFFFAEITGISVSFNKLWKLPYQLFPTIVFICSFGMIPFLNLIVIKTCKISSLKEKIISALLIITFGLTLLISRTIWLRHKAEYIRDLLQRAEFAEGKEIPRIRLEEMYLELYLLLGLSIGTLFSIVLFRKITNKKKNKYLNQ